MLINTPGLTPKQKIRLAHDAVFKLHPVALAAVAARWKIIEDPVRAKTFCTDGKNLIYNPEWCNSMTLGQIACVVLHEVSHVALGHHFRIATLLGVKKLGRAHNAAFRRFNIAADLAINSRLMPEYRLLCPANELQTLIDQGCFPRSGEYAELPEGKSAEWYFQELNKAAKERKEAAERKRKEAEKAQQEKEQERQKQQKQQKQQPPQDSGSGDAGDADEEGDSSPSESKGKGKDKGKGKPTDDVEMEDTSDEVDAALGERDDDDEETGEKGSGGKGKDEDDTDDEDTDTDTNTSGGDEDEDEDDADTDTGGDFDEGDDDQSGGDGDGSGAGGGSGHGSDEGGSGDGRGGGGSDEGEEDGDLRGNVFGDIMPFAEEEEEVEAGRKEFEQGVTAAIIQSKGWSNEKGWLETSLTELVYPVDPEQERFNWRGALRQFLSKMAQSGYSYSRPSRRHGHRKDVILPAHRGKGNTTGLIIVDTSGSMGDAECDVAIRELGDILGEFPKATVRMISCDNRVIEGPTFTRGDFPLKEKVVWQGRGGTNLAPAFKWAGEQRRGTFDWVVVLTDMEWYWDKAPNPGVPVIWLGCGTKPGWSPEARNLSVPFGTFVSVKV